MARPGSPERKMLTSFDNRIHTILEKEFFRAALLFNWDRARELIAQELSLGYVDLAVRSSTHVHWKKRLRTMFLHYLPHLCMEHFMAENISSHQKIQGVYDYIVKHNSEWLEIFSISLDMFSKSWFDLFEGAILIKLFELDNVEKTQMILRYLEFLERSSASPHERLETAFSTLLEHSTNLDAGVTMKILDTFCNFKYVKVWLFLLVPNVNCLDRLILQARSIRFDFWGLWSGTGSLVLNLMELKQENSKILLQYAFPYATDQATFLRICNTVNNIRVGHSEVIQSMDVFTQHADSEKRTRMMLILDIFITFGNFDIATNFNDRINTLLYLTRTLPLPYVTTRELYETMLKAVVPEFQNDLKEIVSNYSNVDIFEDDVSDPIMPRRLMHLCRVVIRRILANNFLLLEGIEQLKIPKPCKEYLRLEN